jgi:hypothetical protein
MGKDHIMKDLWPNLLADLRSEVRLVSCWKLLPSFRVDIFSLTV